MNATFSMSVYVLYVVAVFAITTVLYDVSLFPMRWMFGRGAGLCRHTTTHA